jgi:hypothetical protein
VAFVAIGMAISAMLLWVYQGVLSQTETAHYREEEEEEEMIPRRIQSSSIGSTATEEPQVRRRSLGGDGDAP